MTVLDRPRPDTARRIHPAWWAAFGGGVIRDVTGSYDLAWLLAGGLCLAAAMMSISIRRRPAGGSGSPRPAATPLPAR